MTGTDPTALLDELTRRLLRAEWKGTSDPRPTAPPQPGARTDQRSFTDPTRTVQLHACAYRESGGLETRPCGVDPHRRGALDPPWDTGGWLITRPDQLRPDADIDTTHTPPAVTAALALTD